MTTHAKKVRVVRGEIHDFMRLKFVELRFGEGPILPVRGENEQGKTSLLRAFVALLGGKEASPEKPIREGAESAEVAAELDNGLVIRRRWTKSGNSYLEVQTAEGAAFKAPQKILDDLVGRFSLDPLAFDRMDSKKQVETLRKIAGVDLTPIEAKRQEAYDARTAANKAAAGLKARLDALPEVEAPDQEVTAADLLAEQRRLNGVKAANDARRAELRRFHDAEYAGAVAKVQACVSRVAELERKLEVAREEQRLAEEEKGKAAARGMALKAEVEALVDPDATTVERGIADVDETNRRVRAKRDRAALAREHVVATQEWERLDGAVKAAEAEKEAALAAARFPVDGLGFDEVGVTVDGIPYKQASNARRIRVSMAMALALRPKLPLICIQDGSVLDQRSRAIVHEMAAEAGAQVLLELVSSEGDGIVIEDGEVESIDGVPVPRQLETGKGASQG